MKTLSVVSALALMVSGCGGDSAGVFLEKTDTLCVSDSLGVELGDSSCTFGAILGLEFLPDGSFAVLDRVMGNIRVFSPSGEFIRSISSSGSGPGEVVQAYGMLVFPCGDFGIMDPNQGGLMRFSPCGDYLGLEFEIHHNIPLGMVMVGDSGYVGSRTSILDQGGSSSLETFIGHFPMRWEPDHKYLSSTAPLDMERISGFLMETMLQCPWAADPATGTVYAAPYRSGDFCIDILSLYDSVPARQITMDIPLVEKSPAEIQEEQEYYAALFTVMESGEPSYNVYCDPFPFRHPVRAMDVDESGCLWVLRGDTDDVRFFVFSSSGELKADYLLQGLPQGEQLTFRVQNDMMLLYSENPADYQKIWMVGLPSL